MGERWVARLLVAALLASAPPARADTTAPRLQAIAIFSALGLFGTWSPDCGNPPSASNPRVTWFARHGRIMHTVTFAGTNRAVVDEVGPVALVDEATVIFDVERGGRLFATVTIGLREGRLHVLRSVAADGRVIVDRGIDQASGQPAPTDEKCVAAVS